MASKASLENDLSIGTVAWMDSKNIWLNMKTCLSFLPLLSNGISPQDLWSWWLNTYMRYFTSSLSFLVFEHTSLFSPYCKWQRDQKWKHSGRTTDSWSKQWILKGEVWLYRWPPVGLVWNQPYEYWQFLFLFAKQANPNESNRRSVVQWYFPL